MLRKQANPSVKLKSGALLTAEAMYGLTSQMSAMLVITGMKLQPSIFTMKKMF